MKRQVYLNSMPNVHLYANESNGTNNNNCGSCGTCGGSGSGNGATVVSAVIGATAVIVVGLISKGNIPVPEETD